MPGGMWTVRRLVALTFLSTSTVISMAYRRSQSRRSGTAGASGCKRRGPNRSGRHEGFVSDDEHLADSQSPAGRN
eukprot:254842-Prorocentrum_minimum.AAC.1